MKKYIYAILGLGALGAILSSLLLLVHYYPQSALSAVSCSDSLPGSCSSISNLPFSSILGIPLAAYGLLYYLMICFIILIADYAGDIYNEFAAAIILPAAIFGAAFDIFLAGVLIYEGEFCSLCAATYAVNFSAAAVSLFWIKNICADKNISVKEQYRNLFAELGADSSDRRAAKSLLVLFTAMLAFGVISTDRTMNVKTAGSRVSNAEADRFAENFYKNHPENLNLPESKMILGDPKAALKIIVFTDYLCGACYQFYTIEKTLLKKFKGKVQFVYYSYPLEKECNKTMTNTIYKNSCAAASAAGAAAKHGIFEDYANIHFEGYKNYKGNKYSPDTAVSNFALMKTSAVTQGEFKASMNSREIGSEIESHVDAAKRLNIEATPTFFIASRRIVGIPPVELIEALIKKEIKNNGL